MTDSAPQHQVPVTIEEELRSSYLGYAMSVIVGRAIPDVRDGLKPVHRRILYSMHEQKIFWNQGYKKSARVVGDVLGKYHPHGDQSVYDALVRMAQDFAMRYPLIDGQGNFGSVDGDPAAAMRYTEVRLARLASELLADIDEETVDFGPNFDDSAEEPLVLPSRVPNLLINGSAGIAVGMATNIPPHNLAEVLDATIRLVENPALTVEQLMVDDPATGRLGVKGPDFPTAGFIYGTRGIRDALTTGRGRVVMRARGTVEPMPGSKDREQIVFTEIPYQVNKAEVLKKIAALVNDRQIEGISDLRDESDREGLRIVIELKRDAPAQVVLNNLYQRTDLQSTFGVNCVAIVAGRPRTLSLKEALEHFIAHRREVITRRTRFRLRRAEADREIVEGLGMATTEIDLVIQTIRESKDPDVARSRLMALPLRGLEEFVRRAGRPEAEIAEAAARGQYFLSERQAKAILEMRLSRLTGLERQKLATEYGELCERIAYLESILADDAVLTRVLIDELQDIRQRYADPRRTEIVPEEGDIDLEDLIPDEDVVVTVSRLGYIKRVPVGEYRAQGRGGRGLRAMDTREEDSVTQIFVARTHSHVLFLSDRGKAYRKKVYEIPPGSRTARGRAVVNFVGMEDGEKIAAIVPLAALSEELFLLTITRLGTVKRTSLEQYQSSAREKGIIGVTIDDGDDLLAARVVRETDHVLVGTAQGMSIRFAVSDVRPTGRQAIGVKGIELREGDRVIGMDVIEDESGQQVLTVSANGYGKRTPVAEWRLQNRGGIGVIAMDRTERVGELVTLCLVRPDDQLMVITDKGRVIRTRVAEIRATGRNAQGVRIIRLDEGERVTDVERLGDREEGGEGAGDGGSVPPSSLPSSQSAPPLQTTEGEGAGGEPLRLDGPATGGGAERGGGDRAASRGDDGEADADGGDPGDGGGSAGAG
jgi:DNA gyrase subunit A